MMLPVNKGYISFILLVLILTALLIAGTFTGFPVHTPDNATYILNTPTPYGNYKSLELHSLNFISIQPTPSTISNTPVPSNGTPQPTIPPSVGGSFLCGTNLGLFNDVDWVNNPGAQAAIAKLHIHTLRMPWRISSQDPTGNRLLSSVQIAHSLGIIPLIILPSETQYIPQDIQIVNQINTIMQGSQVFYELGNEVFDSNYLGKWNQIIPQLKPIAVHAWFGGPVAALNAGPGATSSMAQFYVNAKPMPDFLSWHEYTCGHTDSAQYCYDHVANAPGHNWGQHMLDTKAALQALGVNTMPKIFITEWNYDSAAAGVPPGDPRLPTLNNMHFVTAALNELKNIGVYAAYHYVLDTNIDYNLINYNGSIITGEGQDFQAFCQNQ